MVNVRPIEDLFFRPPFSLRLVFSYLSEIGIVQVTRKIYSRLGERSRNEKYISCGVGVVTDCDAGSSAFPKGSQVGFVAAAHPACVSEIAIENELLFPVASVPWPATLCDKTLYASVRPAPRDEKTWESFGGWSSEAGRRVSAEERQRLLASAAAILAQTKWDRATALPMPVRCSPQEQRKAKPGRTHGEKPRAVLFGYGHYAKTNIIPAVERFCDVACVHEIDPLQIPGDRVRRWDTSPHLRESERYDVAFIAGYHHTHAPLTVSALAHGIQAIVVEKPIATTWADLKMLESALKEKRGARLFCAYQKRYSRISQRVIGHFAGQEALSYHCIVYEVPLPAKHWYRWPVSGSRIISNGCHWIDHFLFLNHFSHPVSLDACAGPRGEASCHMTLANGALFTMLLSEEGSGRIGMRDYVEIRAGKLTARVMNDRYCELDSPSRLSKVRQRTRARSYEEMYREIGRRITSGSAGDSRDSVMVSATAVMNMHDAFNADGVGHLSSAVVTDQSERLRERSGVLACR
jgi:predicted dehydrogenase